MNNMKSIFYFQFLKQPFEQYDINMHTIDLSDSTQFKKPFNYWKYIVVILPLSTSAQLSRR